MAGVTGKVAPALTLYNFSQYNPPDAMGETCGEGAVRQTAAVCPASSATLFRGEPLRKAVKGRPLLCQWHVLHTGAVLQAVSAHNKEE